MGTKRVSIVIPAYNAASTLDESLQSLLSQSCRDWEAIVVDDGSEDETGRIAQNYCRSDARIKLLTQSNSGPCVARNAGLFQATGEWVVFLDSDDWLPSNFLETMLTAASETEVDFLHAGWVRVAADGTTDEPFPANPMPDAFAVLSRHCPFAIHSCMLRKELVVEAGGFDPSFVICEDWDLWQRLARMGARFKPVRDIVTFYRMRPRSLTSNADRFFTDALRCLETSHSRDCRVKRPHPRYANGMPRDELPTLKLLACSWNAGLHLGAGRQANHLLDAIEPARHHTLYAEDIAASLFESALLPNCETRRRWPELWARIGGATRSFLSHMEAHSGTHRLADRTIACLERLIIREYEHKSPMTLNSTHAVPVELCAPVRDIPPPPSVRRIHAILFMEGIRIGEVEFPATGDGVPAEVIADAAADKYGWTIMCRFLAANRCPTADWSAFLREVWGKRDWEASRFYNPRRDRTLSTRTAKSGSRIELSNAPANLVVGRRDALEAIFTLGGAMLGRISVPASKGVVSAQAIRAAITTATGFELCRVAVREGIIGLPMSNGRTLRARLARAAARARHLPPRGGREAPIGTSASRRFVLRQSGRSLQPVGKAPAELAVWAARVDALAGQNSRTHFEELLAHQPDPWKTLKDAQTLGLLPAIQFQNAIEVGCAEGGFTAQLAPLVTKLTAADISRTALQRAATRCRQFDNISYRILDLANDPIPGRFDLVVCNDALYYMGNITVLTTVARKLAASLLPGGHLLMAHMHLVIDEPDKPGFDWNLPFGARKMTDVFAAIPSLHLAAQLRTPLYRIDLFRGRKIFRPRPRPRITVMDKQPTPVSVEVKDTIRRNERKSDSHETGARCLPILMYHRVSPGSPGRYAVAPEAFEQQLQHLSENGFYSLPLEDWVIAAALRRPLRGRPIAITFDDAFLDFKQYAHPLLKRHGFAATMFVPTGHVAGTNQWDDGMEPTAPLMNWDDLRELRDDGVHFGAHTVTHSSLTVLPAEDAVGEIVDSRIALERELARPVSAFAYPYGDSDESVQHLVGACGFTVALTCRGNQARFEDPLLALPRIEVAATMDIAQFAAWLV